jgi:hypothetical protein
MDFNYLQLSEYIYIYNKVSNISCRFLCKIKRQYLYNIIVIITLNVFGDLKKLNLTKMY